jgi:outer membrane protein assembly factor BamA
VKVKIIGLPGRIVKFLPLIFLFLLGQKASAQQSFAKTKPVAHDTITDDNRMDVRDVARLLFKKPNLFERKKKPDGPFIVAIPYPGYSIATGVAGVLPINISFYTNLKDKGQLSFFNNNFQYTQYKQAIAFSLSNIFFDHDKWELIGDWRFYNFPTYTFGLGSTTTLLDEDPINYSQLRVYETVMRNIFKNVDVGMGYHLDYHWGISDFNAENGVPSDFQLYGYSKSSLSSAFSADFLYDSRNNANNPKDGIYFNVQFRANAEAFGSNSNWNSLIIDFRKYFRIPSYWPMSMAFWAYGWITTNGKPPYLDLPSTGWDMFNNTGRGYALGRFRGLNMVYFETEFRFAIMRNGLLGGVVFANVESLSQYPSNSFSTLQPGIGLGLRLKLNKRTNTNSAIDYGFGTGGSRGFAFNLNEVF